MAEYQEDSLIGAQCVIDPNNWNTLANVKGPLHLDDVTVTTGKDTISIHINGLALLYPNFYGVTWTRNGEKIYSTERQYSGINAYSNCITIRSPSQEDRGTYTCRVHADITFSRSVTLDIPTATVTSNNITVYFGSKSKFDCNISSCPPPEGMEWQKSIDGKTFCRIDTSKPKYYGSSVNPYQPYLVIGKTTFDDEQFYRAIVWNKIGRIMTKTVYLKVLPNGMCIHTRSNSQDRTITLSVSLKDNSPLPDVFFWTKNRKTIDILERIGKMKMSIHNPSLTIFNVTHDDAGYYELHAMNYLGTTTSDKIVLAVPDVFLERPEENEDGRQCFKVTIRSNPAPFLVQWLVKKKNDDVFRVINPSSPENKGTSDSLTNPVLVVKELEQLEFNCFQIKVCNVIGSTIKVIPEIEKDQDLLRLCTASSTLKSLLNDVTDEMQIHPSKMSFAQELLNAAHKDKIMSEIKSLSNEVILRKTFNRTAYTGEYGNAYVFEVDVVCKKKLISVIQKRPSDWKKILQVNHNDHVRLILVQSKYLRVIEAKLKVYNEYKDEIESENLLLQHVFDDYDEIAKLCAYKKLSWIFGIVECSRILFNRKRLPRIINEALDCVLTPEYIRRFCRGCIIYIDGNPVGSVDDSPYMFYNYFSVEKSMVSVIIYTLEEIGKTLGAEIYDGILQYIELQTRGELEIVLKYLELKLCNSTSFTVKSSLEELLLPRTPVLKAFVKHIVNVLNPVDVNSKEWRDTVARDIYKKFCDKRHLIFDTVLKQIIATSEDLDIFSERLGKAREKIQLMHQNTLIKTWQKRQDLRSIIGLHRYPSVLKCIAGIKNKKQTIKVFLSQDDEEAKEFFKDNDQIPKGTCLDFVNVKEKSENILRDRKESRDLSSFRITENVRKTLGQIIKNQGERVYASHSSIVGLGIGKMLVKNEIKPCIILYSLDKDLIPFGEKPLPTCLEGWPCDIQEDIVMFGTCFDCRQITHPNPGCCIGIPSNGIGSVGFLVKSKETESETAGFLTAAHVAAENWIDLYFSNSFLSVLSEGNLKYEIAHPLLPNCHDFQIIGKVKESFCGNWGSSGTGIDAAFVQNYEPSKGEIRELQIADGRFLNYDERMRVIKRGGTTGETEGFLVDDSFSVCLDQVANDNESDECGFYFFDRCFAIDSIDRPFFERGDSGSGVFLMESGVQTKPLGIAFAKHLISQKTAVCRIDEIVNAFNLCLYQYEESMETS